MAEKRFLEIDYPIIPSGEFHVVKAENVGWGEDDLDDVLQSIEDYLEMHDGNIKNINDSISGLDTRVTALEESKGTVVKIKGRVNTVNDLPNNADAGDLYFVGPESAESFEEYVYTAQKRWEYLGSINDVDLSDYVTKTFLSNQLTGYAKTSDIPAAVTESTVSGWGFTKNSGTYSKPSGGIPKTDLASAVQTSLGKADTAIQAHQDISGKYDSSNGSLIAYGTCTTAAATAAKVVTLSGVTNWSLKVGAVICVKSSYTNTAQNPTLNVNGSGAKPIVYGSANITTSSLSMATESTRQTMYFYNGTAWVWISHNVDNNTTYSNRAAAAGGTQTSLCTDGEKFNWNEVFSKFNTLFTKID